LRVQRPPQQQLQVQRFSAPAITLASALTHSMSPARRQRLLCISHQLHLLMRRLVLRDLRFLGDKLLRRVAGYAAVLGILGIEA
jgi:hypothetical protein